MSQLIDLVGTESCDDGFRCRNGRCLGKANHCDWFCDCGESCEDEMDCGRTNIHTSLKYSLIRPLVIITNKMLYTVSLSGLSFLRGVGVPLGGVVPV